MTSVASGLAVRSCGCSLPDAGGAPHGSLRVFRPASFTLVAGVEFVEASDVLGRRVIPRVNATDQRVSLFGPFNLVLAARVDVDRLLHKPDLPAGASR
jgi:hypothetical protein